MWSVTIVTDDATIDVRYLGDTTSPDAAIKAVIDNEWRGGTILSVYAVRGVR